MKKVAALARAVLFRRVRTLLVRAHDEGMIATLLNFDYEVRSPQEAFKDVPSRKIKGEMLELAKHIIRTKRGKFDPKKFNDRYEAALADLVKAKMEGRPLEKPKSPEVTNVVDLMDALRRSAGAGRESAHTTSSTPTKNVRKKKVSAKRSSAAASRRKAG